MTRARDEAGSPILVSLTVGIQKANLERIPEFVAFAGENRIPKVSFQFLETKHQGKYEAGFYDANSPFSDEARLAEAVRRTRAVAEGKGVVCDMVSEREKGCLWPWDGLYVMWDGKVTPCCLIFDHFVGNAFEEDILSIWNNGKMREFRRRLRSSSVPPQCRACCRLRP
jgi:radical SAM protein with 4Fe4S-binding SPASM domain